jgi:eukaryotic-like serine/threonine-protein kinase
MGSVWVARHLQLDVTIALKFMAPEYASSGEARARFEREAKASAQLKSPHVVQVHDYGVEGDAPFLAMELLEGEDLEDRLARVKRLSLADAAVVVNQVCKALRLAHEAGLVHRDLKPGNLFLARQGDEETVKVLDFGIAKASSLAADQSTKTGSLIGSPHYMSPEQVRNSKQVDPRSDLWSMGVIAFRMLTGRLPFPGEEVGEILVDICTAPIPVPSELLPELGAPVDGFLARALARDPAQRFQSARELSEALSAIAGVTAPRMSLPSVPAQSSGPKAPKGTTMMSAVSAPVSTSPGSVPVHAMSTSPGSAPTHAAPTSPEGAPLSSVATAPGAPPYSSIMTSPGSAPSVASAPSTLGSPPYAAAQSTAGPPSSHWGQQAPPPSGWGAHSQPAQGGPWAPQTMMSPGQAPPSGEGQGVLAKIPLKAILLAGVGALFLIILLLMASLGGSNRRRRHRDRDRDSSAATTPDNPASPPREPAGGSFDGAQPGAIPARTPSRPANHDGCRSSGQSCTCSNTGWSGRCGTGPHKSGLYCRCN